MYVAKPTAAKAMYDIVHLLHKKRGAVLPKGKTALLFLGKGMRFSRNGNGQAPTFCALISQLAYVSISHGRLIIKFLVLGKALKGIDLCCHGRGML